MISYKTLSMEPRAFLALTGLTGAEFRDVLPAFAKAYARAHPDDRTATGQPRQRWPGGGRPSALADEADKLLFVLVYLKTYPLQAVLGKLFGISTSQANYWLHHLLPILRRALGDLGALPARQGARLARRPSQGRAPQRVIIDGTERRRQRPKNAEKQALHYSGKKKAHTDKNVLVVSAGRERVLFLSGTYAGKANDKRIADEARLRYPPGTTLYKDAGFQGYEPPVQQTCQAKKKAAGARPDQQGEAGQPQAGAGTHPGGARPRRGEAQPHRQGRITQHEAGVIRRVHGDRLRPS
jgi:Helix-turn-helix of DDE superfamily endonuclease/DDE superfamily endonuclease